MIIGIDMGGTNIDGVIIDAGRVKRVVKQPVDRDDYFQSIWGCLESLLENQDRAKVSRIHLSTTISTNAIVEAKIPEVGMILQPGPGLRWQFERMGEQLIYISGSVDHRGMLVQPIDTSELDEIQSAWAEKDPSALAVISKFSTRNPEIEQQVADFFKAEGRHITLGHTLSGKLNFPRRVETAYLNAAVAQVFDQFAGHMQSALDQAGIDAPVNILKADGGTVDLATAQQKPVETILSGPAASYMGMSALLKQPGSDRVLLDIGGTTTDLFILVDGVPVFEPQGITIDGRKTLVRAIYSHSIGLGGDSQVRLEAGELKIGPQRVGPAIAFGGQALTPTDALVYLDKMRGEHREKIAIAMQKMAQAQGYSPEELAQAIIAKFVSTIQSELEQVLTRISSAPVYTIKELLAERTIVPDSIGVIGGPAQALAAHLEQCFQLPVEVPQGFAVANAIGAALAKPTRQISLLADTERGILSIPELGRYQEIDRGFDLAQAEQLVLDELTQAAATSGLRPDQLEAEIVEASSYNMVHYYRVDKNIRVVAQIRPGLIETLVDMEMEADHASQE